MSTCCVGWRRDLLCALAGVIVASAVLVPVGWLRVRAERERAEEAERQQAQLVEQAREATRAAEREANRAREAALAAERLEYARAVNEAHAAWERQRQAPEIAPAPHQP
jgi:hypothetical protein